jgi:phosphatidylserine/phosphatidylglycerophosphate/cardiolipin synthase-like enzyme
MRRVARGVARRVVGGAAKDGGMTQLDVQAAVLRALRVGRRGVPHGRVTDQWNNMMAKLLPLGGLSTGNQLSMFLDGDAAFLSMWHAISVAKERVWLETYTLSPDEVRI